MLDGIGRVLSNIGKVLDERLGKVQKASVSPVRQDLRHEEEDIVEDSEEQDENDELEQDDDSQEYEYDNEVSEREPKEESSENWYDPAPANEGIKGRKKK